MRVPLRSERDAFRLALAIVATAVAAIVLGVIAGALWGAILAGVIAVIGFVAGAQAGRGEHVPVLAEAEAESHPAAAAGWEQVLVVANAPLQGEALADEIVPHGGGRVQVDVLAPVLPSPVRYVTSDVDRARSEANRRLEASLTWAREHGLDARGRVGDDNAIASIADELRFFGADRIVVVTHPPEHENRQEAAELERLRAELDVPVAHVVVR